MAPTFPVLRPTQEDSWDCQEKVLTPLRTGALRL